jgi:hypothetical protein
VVELIYKLNNIFYRTYFTRDGGGGLNWQTKFLVYGTIESFVGAKTQKKVIGTNQKLDSGYKKV